MFGGSPRASMMLQLQQCLHNRHVSFSSVPMLPCEFPSHTLHKFIHFRRLSVGCSSQVRSSDTLDNERSSNARWKVVYRKLSKMKNPELGSAGVLDQWENEGKTLSKWELCRAINELRKYKKYERALGVYEWMRNRRERFRLSAGDEGILVDLLAKVRGVSHAEDHFLRLGDDSNDKIYGALLNAYVQTNMKGKAEALLDQMRSKGYATDSLTYNVMMTLYMNLKEYGKVEAMALEMIEKKIQLDIYSYNIWLSSSASQGLAEKVGEVLDHLKSDKFVVPNWTTFSTLATVYIKLDQFEKAEECLKMVEDRVTGRNKLPYHYLLSLYGSIGKKEEVYRVWNTYKSLFHSIPNLGYHAIISSLITMNDTEGADKLYEEWRSVKSSYDLRIGNLLMGSYVKNGDIDKALSFFDHMIESGGEPNSISWELCAQGHLAQRRISDALSCFKEAFKCSNSKGWKPKPRNISAFFNVCEEANDTASKKVLVDLLRQSGFLKGQSYAASIGLAHDETLNSMDTPSENHNDTSVDGSEMLLNQLESGL